MCKSRVKTRKRQRSKRIRRVLHDFASRRMPEPLIWFSTFLHFTLCVFDICHWITTIHQCYCVEFLFTVMTRASPSLSRLCLETTLYFELRSPSGVHGRPVCLVRRSRYDGRRGLPNPGSADEKKT